MNFAEVPLPEPKLQLRVHFAVARNEQKGFRRFLHGCEKIQCPVIAPFPGKNGKIFQH